MADSKNNSFFTLIGRIATILAIVLAILKVVDWVKEPRKDLSAVITFRDHSPTPEFEIYRDNVNQIFDPEVLKQRLVSELGTDQDEDNLMRRVSSEVWLALREADNVFRSERWDMANGFVLVSVQNRGSKSLNGVQISVPYQLAWAEARSDFTFSPDPISIDELKPQETKIVRIWVRHELSEHSVDDVSIVHDDGIATIDAMIPISSRSFALWVSEWAPLLIPLGIMVAFLLVPMLADYASNANKTKKAGKSDTKSLTETDGNSTETNDGVEQAGAGQPEKRSESIDSPD